MFNKNGCIGRYNIKFGIPLMILAIKVQDESYLEFSESIYPHLQIIYCLPSSKDFSTIFMSTKIKKTSL